MQDEIIELRRLMADKFIGQEGIHDCGNNENVIRVYYSPDRPVSGALREEIQAAAHPFPVEFNADEIPKSKKEAEA